MPVEKFYCQKLNQVKLVSACCICAMKIICTLKRDLDEVSDKDNDAQMRVRALRMHNEGKTIEHIANVLCIDTNKADILINKAKRMLRPNRRSRKTGRTKKESFDLIDKYIANDGEKTGKGFSKMLNLTVGSVWPLLKQYRAYKKGEFKLDRLEQNER